MPPEDLQKKLRRQPFQAFRMYLSDGAAYDVTHPELVLLGRRSLVLGLAGSPDDTLYERTVDVDLLHIVRMEPLEPQHRRGDGES
jgi:hypothetical protein